jgi:dTDP-4-dehydrorhamnose 3,5-epimerase
VDAVTVAHAEFFVEKQIRNSKGDLYHALRRSSPGFVDFGEAYFTTVKPGEIKGWKRHSVMHMNLLVPVGVVRFYLRDERGGARRFEIGVSNYGRLSVPPGLWMAFEGIGADQNMVLNIASIEHDPLEADNLPLEAFPTVET